MASISKPKKTKSGKTFYRVDYRDSTGRRRKERYPTLAEAKARLVEVAAGQHDGTLRARADDRKLCDVIEDWRLEHLPGVRPNTRAVYVRMVEKFIQPQLGQRKMRSLTIRDVEQLRAHVESAVTVGKRKSKGGRVSGNMSLTVMRMVLGYARKHKLVADNVASYVKRRAAPMEEQIARNERTMLSSDQLRSLLDSATPGLWRTFLTLIAMTGLRKGEALGLKWSDIDWSRSRFRVSRQLQRGKLAAPKSMRSNRWVHMPPELVSAMKRWRLEAVKAETDLVFLNDRGKPFTGAECYERGLKPALRRAGLPAMRLHGLRHDYASRLLSEGAPPKAVAVALGDTLEMVLKVYAHLLPDDAESLAAIMSRAVFGGNAQGTSSREPPREARRS